jgi:hypothetical protein
MFAPIKGQDTSQLRSAFCLRWLDPLRFRRPPGSQDPKKDEPEADPHDLTGSTDGRGE